MARPKKRVTFSPVDAAWLRMDRPTNMMMITGIMMFDKPLSMDQLKEVVKTRLLIHDRFRQRVRESAVGLPHWEDDPHFDVNAHLHHAALPAPGDIPALQDMAGDLMSTPLDYNKPLWHFHIIDNFNGGSALIGRLHHCIGDGLALMDVLLSMTDDPVTLTTGRRPISKPTFLTRAIDRADTVLHETFQTLARPSHVLELARQGSAAASELAKQGTEYAAALGKLLLTPPDRKTLFKAQCGVSKRVAWSAAFPIEDVKAIGRKLNGTINDVLLAAVAGALRRYLEFRGEPYEDVEIRAMVPVSIRRPHEMGELGNRFGLIILTLPVCVVDPVERLAILKRRMDEIKSTPEASVAYGILAAIGQSPLEAERLVVDIFASKVSAVMTNVPGPKQPLYLAGNRLTGLMFWVPVASSLGMGISILSYAGSVTVGVATDSCVVPDPQTIVDGFHAELSEMRERLAGLPKKTRASAGTAEVSIRPEGLCVATTQLGQPCKNRAMAGLSFCRVHAVAAVTNKLTTTDTKGTVRSESEDELR